MKTKKATISAYKYINDAHPDWVGDMAWDLLMFVTAKFYSLENKEDGPAWSPAAIKPGKTEKNKNVTDVGALVLNFNDQCAYSVQQALEDLKWNSFMHSTFSNTIEKMHFQVIIQTSRPIKPWEYYFLLDYANEKLGGGATISPHDISRRYLLPCHHVDRGDDAFAVEMEGSPLNVDGVIDKLEESCCKRDASKAEKNSACTWASSE